MFSPEQIEASRQRLGIAPDWEWYSCANGCGDLVWVPPGVGPNFSNGVVPAHPVCSAACALEYMKKLPDIPQDPNRII